MVRAPFGVDFINRRERTAGWDLLRVGQLPLVVFSSGAVFFSSLFTSFLLLFIYAWCFFSGAVFLFFPPLTVAHRVGAASCVGFARRYLQGTFSGAG